MIMDTNNKTLRNELFRQLNQLKEQIPQTIIEIVATYDLNDPFQVHDILHENDLNTDDCRKFLCENIPNPFKHTNGFITITSMKCDEHYNPVPNKTATARYQIRKVLQLPANSDYLYGIEFIRDLSAGIGLVHGIPLTVTFFIDADGDAIYETSDFGFKIDGVTNIIK